MQPEQVEYKKAIGDLYKAINTLKDYPTAYEAIYSELVNLENLSVQDVMKKPQSYYNGIFIDYIRIRDSKPENARTRALWIDGFWQHSISGIISLDTPTGLFVRFPKIQHHLSRIKYIEHFIVDGFNVHEGAYVENWIRSYEFDSYDNVLNEDTCSMEAVDDLLDYIKERDSVIIKPKLIGGQVYLLWDPSLPKNVRKLGMSADLSYRRISSYGPHTVIYARVPVTNPRRCERKLIKAFNERFTLHKGREYFSGDVEKMTSLFFSITGEYTGHNPLSIESILSVEETDNSNVPYCLKSKMKVASDLAEEWIAQYPYKNKKTRCEYHAKYKKHQTNDNRRFLSIQKFAEVMHNLGFREYSTGKRRLWVKKTVEDSDSDSDEDKKNDDSDSE